MNVLRHVNAINMGVCILIWVIGCANAKVLKRCILPAPDGGVEKLSKPNLHGVIKKVDLNTNEAEIKIKEGGAVSFIFNEETLYFTVFGGDFIMDDLKKVKNTEACVFRSIRSRIGIEVRSAIRIHSINRELNFFYRFLTRFSLLSTTGGFFLSDSP